MHEIDANKMNNEECADILIESLEVFLHHILYTRDLYPSQIFKKRRIYNTPIYVSIFPPLNTYLYRVLQTVRELCRHGELQCVEMLFYRNEMEICERYNFQMTPNVSAVAEQQTAASNEATEELSLPPMLRDNDEFLLDFEEQLRTSLYTLAERLKTLERLPNDAKFKVLVHTTQAGFVRLSHNPHYQEFPWLHETLRSESIKNEISLLPLTSIQSVGLQLMAEVL